jgi:hypothetical protein
MAAGELVRYVTQHDDALVSRLVLVAPACTPFRMQSPDNPNGAPAAVLEQLRQVSLLKDLPKTLRSAMPGFLLPDSSPGMLDWVIRMVEQTSLRRLLNAIRSKEETASARNASSDADAGHPATRCVGANRLYRRVRLIQGRASWCTKAHPRPAADACRAPDE